MTPPPPDSDTRGADRRQAIMEATLRLIATRGIDAVRHRAVAEEAGVPLAATTYYFASKTEMVEEALAFAAEAEMARVAAQAQRLRAGDLSPAAWAESVTQRFAEALSAEGRSTLVWRYQLKLCAGYSERCRELCVRWIEGDIALLRDLLERSGSPQPDRDATVVAGALEGLRLNAHASRAEGLDEPALRGQIERLITALTR